MPDLEPKHTFYVSEDSTDISALTSIYVKPDRMITVGLEVGFGNNGIGKRYEYALYRPGFFINASFQLIKELKFFWEGYFSTYWRNIGFIVSPLKYFEIFGFFRYCQYWPNDPVKLRQFFTGVRINIPLREEKLIVSTEEMRKEKVSMDTLAPTAPAIKEEPQRENNL